MTPPVFYVDRMPPDTDTVVVAGAEAQHAVRVRRMRAGEALRVADGQGSYVDGVVASVGRHELAVLVHQRGSEPAYEPTMTVVQALPKGERAGLAVELLTEIGVDAIVPWQSARCVTRWDDPGRAQRGVERWRSIAREAAKQSRRSRVPVVSEPADTTAVSERVRAAALAVILDETAPLGLEQLAVPTAGEVVVVVGPEGGLTQDEVDTLSTAGGKAVRLGREVLRTSTAGLAAVAVLGARAGRWSVAPGTGAEGPRPEDLG